jgi:short-subunit dehydrogenase
MVLGVGVLADMQFSGKVFYITGASSGIGFEMARQVVAAGGRVAMFARRLPVMQGLVSELNRGGVAAAAFACDVTRRDQLAAAFAAAETALGPCDVLVANAGTGYPVRVSSFDGEAAADIYRLNIFGVLYAIEAVLPSMRQRKSGHIVGMSSLAAFRSFPESHPYCATKSALNAHLEGLRPELMPYNIAVTALCPGFIKTDLTASNTVPMPFIMDVHVAVRKMLRAIAAKRARYAFPWQMYALIRLSRLVPDTLIARSTRGKSYKDV